MRRLRELFLVKYHLKHYLKHTFADDTYTVLLYESNNGRRIFKIICDSDTTIRCVRGKYCADKTMWLNLGIVPNGYINVVEQYKKNLGIIDSLYNRL